MGVSVGDIGSLTPHSGTRKDGILLTPVAVRNQRGVWVPCRSVLRVPSVTGPVATDSDSGDRVPAETPAFGRLTLLLTTPHL
jgi:hypothetical protein